MVRIRVKTCDRCETIAEVLYRIQIDRSNQWQFICDNCHQAVRSDHPDYIYGGTWKSRK
jgi:hypothetical protein